MVKFYHHKNHCFSAVFFFFAKWSKGTRFSEMGVFCEKFLFLKEIFPKLLHLTKKTIILLRRLSRPALTCVAQIFMLATGTRGMQGFF
jgi:hypothetical protein